MWYRAEPSITDAVLRSFEKIADCHAIRPDIAGIMGAFGAALIARERYEEGKETTMLSIDKINSLKYTTSMANCRGCTNNCRLTINKILRRPPVCQRQPLREGNRQRENKDHVPNLYEYKYKRCFPTSLLRRIRQSEDRWVSPES